MLYSKIYPGETVSQDIGQMEITEHYSNAPTVFINTSIGNYSWQMKSCSDTLFLE